jgi:beta-1,4-N-acetylglucosaminyltransferase
MERSNYLLRAEVQCVIRSTAHVALTGPRDLIPAIRKAEDFRAKMAQFPPITSGKHRETKTFAAVMDETMGFWD